MRHHFVGLLVVLAVAGADGRPAFGQPRAVDLVDVQAIWGYNYGLDDSPPKALVGGVAVTAAVTPHFRVGGEALKANLYGPWSTYKQRAVLVRAVLKHELRPGRRANPYWVVGVGQAQYRGLLPTRSYSPAAGREPFEWEVQKGLNVTGGIGIRLFVTERLFVAPEVRFGLAPLFHTTMAVGFAF